MVTEREKLAKTVRIILICFAGFLALLAIACFVSGMLAYMPVK